MLSIQSMLQAMTKTLFQQQTGERGIPADHDQPTNHRSTTLITVNLLLEAARLLSFNESSTNTGIRFLH